MELQIRIIGGLLVLLALLHLFFPRYFKWKKEFDSLTLINRQMVYVHMFFVALGVFLLGLLCLTSSEALLTTTLGRRISLGIGIFWAARLYVQFFVYSATLWKGKTFETIIHIVLALFWAYISIIFTLGFLKGYAPFL
jgi:hypothetical protein